MKFYCGGKIDEKGHFNLKGFIEPGSMVEIWVEDPDFDLVHVKTYLDIDDNKVPKYGVKRVDEQNRVIIPKALRRNATYALIADETKAGKGILLKLFSDDIDCQDEIEESDDETAEGSV